MTPEAGFFVPDRPGRPALQNLFNCPPDQKRSLFFDKDQEDVRCHHATQREPFPTGIRNRKEIPGLAREQDLPGNVSARNVGAPFPIEEEYPAQK